MSRSYKGIRPKAKRVYSIDDVIELYGVCRNTVSNWVGSGLRPSGGIGPQLFRGAELSRFHAERRVRSGGKLRSGEFKCRICSAAVFPVMSSLVFNVTKPGTKMASSRCPDCSGFIWKILGETECVAIKKCIITNTPLYSIDEEKEPKSGGIGKNLGNESNNWNDDNDRIIFEWQVYAGRFNSKTVDSYLVAIREFERTIKGKPFNVIKKGDVAIYRDTLIKRGKLPPDAGGLGKSAIRHRASHLSKFLAWLCKQEGYRRLNGSLYEYIKLPRGATAQALSLPPKLFPTIDEAISMAGNMPERTRFDRRQRAIFALAFVSGFRASALISLQLRHIDVGGKRAIQDGANIRAKNGKSYTANWFPRTEPLQHIIVEWIDDLRSIGARPEDALFPQAQHLAAPAHQLVANRPPVPPMKTQAAVTEAFRQASLQSNHEYSPHSARHCLAALGEQICRTSEQKKAWSLNLGHSSEQITRTHYAKVSEVRKSEIFEGFSEKSFWTDEEKDLMLDYHDHKLHPGTPEYQRAKQLVSARAK